MVLTTITLLITILATTVCFSVFQSFLRKNQIQSVELNAKSLEEAVKKALSRLESLQVSMEYKNSGRPLLQSYYEKFFMRLLHNLFDSEEQFELQTRDLRLDFTEACYFTALCQIREEAGRDMDYGKLMNLYNSALQMAKEIIGRHLPAYVVSLDMKHFAVVFHLPELEDYQEARQAFGRASTTQPMVMFTDNDTATIRNAFNISVFKSEITKAFNEFDTEVLSRTMTEIIQLQQPHIGKAGFK